VNEGLSAFSFGELRFSPPGRKKQSCPDLHPPHAFPLGEGGSAHRALTDEGENRIFANAYV